MQSAAGGDRLDRFDIGLEDADVAVGEAGRGAAALLKFLLAGGGARIDQDVAHAQLLDEAQGLFLGAGADGQHPDDRADAEDDAQGREQRARLLRAQVGQRLADVGEAEDHLESAFMAPFCWARGGFGLLVGIRHGNQSPS